ncbi:MAG TPA: hypothetical protein VGH81_01040 [Rudaea sp.]|jgi:hypothetical protein
MLTCNQKLNRGGALLRNLCFAMTALIFAPLALAQPYDSETTATEGLSCAGDRGASSCTANDFAVSVSATSSSNIVSCQFNQPVVLDIVANVTGATPNRYNVGLFIGEAGNFPAAAGGLCSVTTFPTTDTNPPTTQAWTDFDGNVCGDYTGGGLTTVNLVHNVKVNCVPDAVTGNLSIPFAITWSNSAGNATSCNGPADVAPGTGSKCNGSAGAPVGGVVVTYNADPACGGKTVTYNPGAGTVTSSFIIQNNDPGNAIPADPADGTQYHDVVPGPVVVTGAVCAVQSGAASCGTGPVVAGNDVSGTLPTFPTGSSVMITITGTVSAGQTGSYSNTADVIPPANLTEGSDSTGNNSCSNSATLPVKLQSFDVH